VAHHGSDASSGIDFLQYLQVKTAVISCGKDNIYGHPTPTVLQNLSSVGAKAYRTDLLGTVIITVKPTGEYTLA